MYGCSEQCLALLPFTVIIKSIIKSQKLCLDEVTVVQRAKQGEMRQRGNQGKSQNQPGLRCVRDEVTRICPREIRELRNLGGFSCNPDVALAE